MLVVITYCLVCAGPYGIEEVVQAAGPARVMVFVLAVALLMGFPAAMIYSELGSMFPQTGSTILWSYRIQQRVQQEFDERAGQLWGRRLRTMRAGLYFSKFVARFSANLLLLKAIVDNAVYPTMICDYLQQVAPALAAWYYRLLVSVLSFSVIFVFNMYGVDAVGTSQYVITALLLAPVVLFVVLAFPDYDIARLSWDARPATVDYVTALSNLVWQFSGYDQLTNLSDSIKNPWRTLPITYVGVIFLVMLTYMMTVVSGVMVEQDFSAWDNGALATISLKLRGCGNGWLQWCLTLGGAVSAFAILNSSVTCTALELYCNAHVGLLPFPGLVDRRRSFRRRTAPAEDRPGDDTFGPDGEEHGLVPWAAVIVVSVFPVLLVTLPFNTIIRLDAFLIAFNMLVQIALYIYHRHGCRGYYSRSRPGPDVFHLPGGPLATAAIVCCPLAVGAVLVVAQGLVTAGIFVGLQALIFAVYGVQLLAGRARRRRVRGETARLYREVGCS